MTWPWLSSGAHITLDSLSATTLSLVPKKVSFMASLTISGSFLVDHVPHDAVADAALAFDRLPLHVAGRAHPQRCFVPSAGSTKSSAPRRAEVTSITPSSRASSSASSDCNVISRSLNSNSLRRLPSSRELCALLVLARLGQLAEDAEDQLRVPSVMRSPLTRRARRLRLPLMLISASRSSSSIWKSRR
jgi:hypothetical protein